jgi:hypothetical protein
MQAAKVVMAVAIANLIFLFGSLFYNVFRALLY